jgi:hypothetical protein
LDAAPGDRDLDVQVEREVFNGEVYASADVWEKAGRPHHDEFWPDKPAYPVVWELASGGEGHAAHPVPDYSTFRPHGERLRLFLHQRRWGLEMHASVGDCYAEVLEGNPPVMIGTGRGTTEEAALARAILMAVRRTPKTP